MAIDYDSWAKTYDQTRGVSASVLKPLLETLGTADGRTILDIGGGTGNYSVALRDAGFAVTHCDPSPGMVSQALAKPTIGDALVATGEALPFKDGSFDCAIAIKVLNHVQDRPAFMREARRVLLDGPLVLLHATRESLEGNWITHYVPSILGLPRFEPERATVEQMRDSGFRSVEISYISYEDMTDGSAQALKRHPEALLSDELIMNTSLLSRLPEDDRRAAFEAIRRDNETGRLQELVAEYASVSERNGDGTVFVGRR